MVFKVSSVLSPSGSPPISRSESPADLRSKSFRLSEDKYLIDVCPRRANRCHVEPLTQKQIFRTWNRYLQIMCCCASLLKHGLVQVRLAFGAKVSEIGLHMIHTVSMIRMKRSSQIKSL